MLRTTDIGPVFSIWKKRKKNLSTLTQKSTDYPPIQDYILEAQLNRLRFINGLSMVIKECTLHSLLWFFKFKISFNEHSFLVKQNDK